MSSGRNPFTSGIADREIVSTRVFEAHLAGTA